MRKNFKKIIAILLVLVMTFGFAPAVFAEGEEGTGPVYGSEGSFEFAVITPEEGDAYAELVKYTGDLQEVTVPADFEGTPLKVIGHEAFFAATMEKVTLPEGVEIIDSRAFANCIYLDNVIFPDSIKEIGDYAFSGCYYKDVVKDLEAGNDVITESGISYFHIPASLEKIGDFAFAGCELLVGNAYIPSNVSDSPDAPALLLPASLKEIGADAFSGCRSLVNVIIPEGVTEVKTGTFTNCAGLERVEIPSTVTHIGPAFNSAFTAHNRLSEYEPVLVIKAPHCIIEDSPNMDAHVIIYGAEHSSVQAYVDGINAAREDEYFYGDYEELVGTEPDIDYMQFVIINVPGHDFVGTDTVPTCTERGFTTYICQQCSDAGYYDEPELAELYVPHICDYVLPLGHDYCEWIEDSPAGCETIGSKHRICQRQLTEADGTPIFEEDGVTPVTCGFRDNRQIPAAGHNFVSKSTMTCTEGGRSWKECTVCTAKKDIEPHAALGHTFDYENPDVIIAELVECDGSGTNATVDGKYEFVCRTCGLRQTAVKAAHPDENNDFYCDKCGKFIGSSDASPEKNCTCDCHVQTGIIAWFYKIKLFVWKLFKVSKVCKCGAMHY